jgi:phytoene synthase
VSADPRIAEAYRSCEQLTHAAAANFYYGIRLLPAPRRAALCAVYALARRIDDIADGPLDAGSKHEALQEVRTSVHSVWAAGHDDVLIALGDACRRFPIPVSAFEELIDGADMDVAGATYETFDDLLAYCSCVAGATGRLTLGVFGAREREHAAARANALGVAMQLTNILRDIREDAEMGRVYLPHEDLERFGCDLTFEPDPIAAAALIGFEADRAQRWFEEGLRLLPLLDRRSAACAGTIAGIYRQLLERIRARPLSVFQDRVALTKWEKYGTAARSLARAAL